MYFSTTDRKVGLHQGIWLRRLVEVPEKKVITKAGGLSKRAIPLGGDAEQRDATGHEDGRGPATLVYRLVQEQFGGNRVGHEG